VFCIVGIVALGIVSLILGAKIPGQKEEAPRGLSLRDNPGWYISGWEPRCSFPVAIEVDNVSSENYS
jgi:hypothetical protein